MGHVRAARNARRLHGDARRVLARAEDTLDAHLTVLVARGRRAGMSLGQIAGRTGLPARELARRDHRRAAIVSSAPGTDALGTGDVLRAAAAVRRARVREAMAADVRRRATWRAVDALRADGLAWWHVAEELGISEARIHALRLVRRGRSAGDRPEECGDLLDAGVWREMHRAAYAGCEDRARLEVAWAREPHIPVS